MKTTNQCPKCGGKDIIRVPDSAHRYLANSICVTRLVFVERIPVARYVCCGCGYVENWVEHQQERDAVKKAWG